MVVNSTESNGLNRTFADKGTVEKGLVHLFVAPSSSHFFYKTDLEQYLFDILQFKITANSPIIKQCR